MTNANCVHQFHFILVKDIFAHVFICVLQSSFVGREIESVLGLEVQVLGLEVQVLGLEVQVLVYITDCSS